MGKKEQSILRQRSEKFFKLNRENKLLLNPLSVEMVNRKKFKELTTDKKLFGRVIQEGIKPHEMSDTQYDNWVMSLPKQRVDI